MIAGKALLTGNDDGADGDVSDEIMELIFKAQCYKVEVDGKVEGDGLTYEELPFAYAGVYHMMPPTPGSEVRISAAWLVPSRTPRL